MSPSADPSNFPRIFDSRPLQQKLELLTTSLQSQPFLVHSHALIFLPPCTYTMAPSRGRTLLFSPRNHHLNLRINPSKRFSSSLTNRIKSSPLQIYISRSPSPKLNLSLEHHLLLSSPPTSRILFLYTNTPSIIIGRNQNPWTEVSLSSLSTLSPAGKGKERDFELVRRRSGGGTVMHDEGNVNYSVIVPSEEFDRDRHAVMVTRALEGLGVEGVRVNCRHDIVVDVASSSASPVSSSLRDSERVKGKETAPAPIPEEAPGCDLKKGPEDGKSTFKISGSAYKLTRLRSLHHGTCLLSSPNLKTASKLLTSPGKPFFKARGVESVRSPIMNVGVGNEEFERGVVEEFKRLYEEDSGDVEVQYVSEKDMEEIPEVKKGVEEMRSEDWIWGQTPQFTFDTEVKGSELAKQLPKGVSKFFLSPNSHPTTYQETILTPPKVQSKLHNPPRNNNKSRHHPPTITQHRVRTSRLNQFPSALNTTSQNHRLERNLLSIIHIL